MTADCNLALLLLQLDNAVAGLRIFADALEDANLPGIASDVRAASDAFTRVKAALGALPDCPWLRAQEKERERA